MSLLYDQYGNQLATRKLVDAAGRQVNYSNFASRDLDELIPQLDHQKLISASRKLYSNNGTVRGVIDEKASYSVGRAFLPIFKGKDREWGEFAQDQLTQWLNHADLSRFNDWQTLLFLSSVEMDRDGDSFILLTTNPNSEYPQIQLIPSHRVGQKDPNEKVVAKGKYKGNPIQKGVIYDRKTGRAIAYRVRNDDESYREISSSSMIHLIDPQWVGQKRGLPLFSSAINVFRDLQTASEREMFAQMLLSSLVLAEHNSTGAADDDDITQVGGNACGGSTNVQNFEQGMVKYFKAGDGSKIEPILSQRPTIEWQQFQDRLRKQAVVGVGWSETLMEGNPDFNSVSTRLAIKLAEKAVEDRQQILIGAGRRILAYATARFINLGILPKNNEFWKWGYTLPPKISIDAGRDSAAMINEYDKGIRNLADIVGESGNSVEQHIRQRVKEEILERQIREEEYKKAGITLKEESE